MPIDFDDQSVDVSGVDDRRGGGGLSLGGGGVAIGGGVGIVGAIILVLINVLGGGGGSGGGVQLPGVQPGVAGSGAGARTESADQLRQRCNTAGALDKYTDCRLIKVYTIANTAWKGEFGRLGLSFHTPRIAFFSNSAQTGCGPASADVGPFYCPADQEIYFELDFLQELQTRFGASGQFAQAYIVAHEYGHHLQTLLGTEPKVRAAQQRDPSQTNKLSVKLELQADCYAGVWAYLADQLPNQGIGLKPADMAEAVNAAGAVGDDRIQSSVQGRVNPEKFTHGTSAQREQWLQTGYSSHDINACNTFA